jgi:aminoglycoside phosphotransferase (APT) family kinase protein
VPARTLAWLAGFVEGLPAWAAAYARQPLTLLHLDYRLDNLVFPPGGEVVVLDWQTAIWGPGALDLASFCATSLTTPDRRRLEGELLARYTDGIGRGLGAEALWAAYRSALLWWMAIFANNLSRIEPGQGRAEALFGHMVERTFAAADDLDAGDLLP